MFMQMLKDAAAKKRLLKEFCSHIRDEGKIRETGDFAEQYSSTAGEALRRGLTTRNETGPCYYFLTKRGQAFAS